MTQYDEISCQVESEIQYLFKYKGRKYMYVPAAQFAKLQPGTSALDVRGEIVRTGYISPNST